MTRDRSCAPGPVSAGASIEAGAGLRAPRAESGLRRREGARVASPPLVIRPLPLEACHKLFFTEGLQHLSHRAVFRHPGSWQRVKCSQSTLRSTSPPTTSRTGHSSPRPPAPPVAAPSWIACWTAASQQTAQPAAQQAAHRAQQAIQPRAACWAAAHAWPISTPPPISTQCSTCASTRSSRALTRGRSLAWGRSRRCPKATRRLGSRRAFGSRAPTPGCLLSCRCTPLVAHAPQLLVLCPSSGASSTTASCCPGRTCAAALWRIPRSQRSATERANATWLSRTPPPRFPSSRASALRRRGGSWTSETPTTPGSRERRPRSWCSSAPPTRRARWTHGTTAA